MASKRATRRRRCGGKKRYDTPAHAGFDAAVLRHRDHSPVQAYLCPHCGGIGVGHVPTRLEPAPTPRLRER